MDDARFVRRQEPVGDLPGDRRTCGNGNLPSRCRTVARSVAFDVRHRDVLDAVDLAEVVNANDVAVSDLPASSSSCLKRRSMSWAAAGILVHFGANDFQRDALPARRPRPDRPRPCRRCRAVQMCSGYRTAARSRGALSATSSARVTQPRSNPRRPVGSKSSCPDAAVAGNVGDDQNSGHLAGNRRRSGQ